MRPGNTKSVALGASYQRLATLYDSSFTGEIKDGPEAANQALLSIITQGAEIAYGTTQPVVSGHPLAAGDSLTMGNLELIRRAWLRYTTTGSILVITPIYE
jgi:hypothetical protein